MFKAKEAILPKWLTKNGQRLIAAIEAEQRNSLRRIPGIFGLVAITFRFAPWPAPKSGLQGV